MIHIGLCADEQFALPLGVCITSILESNKDEDLRIHIITQRLSEETINRIKESERIYRRKEVVNIHLVDDDIFSNYPLSAQFPKSIYYRYLFAEILPKTIDKILYIDCDTVILSNLRELYNTPLSDNELLGAVEDRNSDDIIIRNRIGRWNGKYFNSGVLLMNLKAWRNCNAFEQLASFILNNPQICIYPDQDAINIVFDERIKELPYRYNFLMSFIAPFETYRLHLSKKNLVEESFKDVAIVHYAAEMKPWYRDSVHPLLFLWRYFYKRSAWSKTKLKYRKSFISRVISKIIIYTLYRGQQSSVNENMKTALEDYHTKY